MKDPTISRLLDNVKKFYPTSILRAVKGKTQDVQSGVQNVVKKVSQIEKNASVKLEKWMLKAVDTLLDTKDPALTITKEIKREIVKNLTPGEKGRNLVPMVKYFRKILFKSMSRSKSPLKKLRSRIAHTLVHEATQKLERKKH